MSMRPLERFRSIRAKLGSVIVLAVALTLLVPLRAPAHGGHAAGDLGQVEEAVEVAVARAAREHHPLMRSVSAASDLLPAWSCARTVTWYVAGSRRGRRRT